MAAPSWRAVTAGALALLLVAGPLAGCDGSDAPDDDLRATNPPGIARILPAGQAIAGADVPTLDPRTMRDAEIRLAIGDGPLCAFHYARAGRPVLAVSAGPGGAAQGPAVVKLNGHLVILQPHTVTQEAAPALRLAAEPLRITLAPTGPMGGEAWREANMMLEIGEALRVGYRGYVACRPEPRVRPRHS
ncbi:MAG: hypothetical protein K2X49_23625 [Acetobacteraceae bacterium]|nr:hypothetical protein [Acetobacteraceae bacterium]